jgi:hypothetical protein
VKGQRTGLSVGRNVYLLPNVSHKQLIDDFERQYVHSEELNEVTLNQLLEATQRGSLERFYDFVSA